MEAHCVSKESKWIVFILVKEGDKTDIWHICTKDLKEKLGEIKWFGRWRTYAFFPYQDTIYEDDCLIDIANFIKEEMNARKLRKL